MKNITQSLIEILYMPSQYIHQEYLSNPILDTGLLNDQLLNTWILHTYKLDGLQNFSLDDELIELLILSWKNIPLISLLIGAFLCRDNILLNSKLIISKPILIKFISLPIIHQRVSFDKNELSLALFLRLGLVFILKTCPNLPTGLAQRIKLHSPNGTLPLELNIAKNPPNINLLRIAINYANNT